MPEVIKEFYCEGCREWLVIQCPDCKGYGDYGGTEDGRNIPCHVCRGEGVIKNTPRLQELLEETDD